MHGSPFQCRPGDSGFRCGRPSPELRASLDGCTPRSPPRRPTRLQSHSFLQHGRRSAAAELAPETPLRSRTWLDRFRGELAFSSSWASSSSPQTFLQLRLRDQCSYVRKEAPRVFIPHINKIVSRAVRGSTAHF